MHDFNDANTGLFRPLFEQLGQPALFRLGPAARSMVRSLQLDARLRLWFCRCKMSLVFICVNCRRLSLMVYTRSWTISTQLRATLRKLWHHRVRQVLKMCESKSRSQQRAWKHCSAQRSRSLVKAQLTHEACHQSRKHSDSEL